MIIDMENHAAIPEQLEKGSSGSGMLCERYWDNGKMKVRLFQTLENIERRLKFMDENSIDMAALTATVTNNLKQCKSWNDYCANIVRRYPEQFVGFATIPPLGGDPAFDELERAVTELGLKGVHIWTRTEGRHLDSREMWPFYQKVSKLGIPVDVHITSSPPGFDSIQAPYALYYVMAREVDMLMETLRICLGGVLEDFPDLVFIMNHFGGGVSSVLERLDTYMNFAGPGYPGIFIDKPLISKPWREYFNKLYFNMGGREVGMATVKCALTNISPKRLLFATDWPYNYDIDSKGAKRYIQEIRKLELPKEEIEAMLGGTAVKLLHIS